MPMPELDPTRFIAAALADPSHKLPLPDRGGRLFLKEGETVDSWNPFYAHLLADGSLKPVPAPVAPAEVETPTKSTTPASDAETSAAPPAAEPDAAH